MVAVNVPGRQHRCLRETRHRERQTARRVEQRSGEPIAERHYCRDDNQTMRGGFMSLNRNASVTTKSSQHPAAVEAVLNYLAPTNERTRTYINNPPPGELRTTVVPEAHVVLIVNLRPFASSVSLDREGFSLVHHDTAVTDFYDDEEVKAIYYPEVERTLKVATGADRVLITGHITRRRVPGAENSWTSIRQPLARVHVDNTARSGPQRLRDLLLEDAEELLRGRVQIVNLWRP